MSLDVDLVVDSIPKMLEGIGLTFQLLFLSLVLGTARRPQAAFLRRRTPSYRMTIAVSRASTAWRTRPHG